MSTGDEILNQGLNLLERVRQERGKSFYKCALCEYNSRRKYNYVRHMLTIHKLDKREITFNLETPTQL